MIQPVIYDRGVDSVGYQQIAAIAQSRDTAALIEALRPLVSCLCQASSLRLYWLDPEPEIVGGYGEAQGYSPSQDELERLQQNCIVSTALSPEEARHLIALQAHGVLRGWLLLVGAPLSGDAQPLLSLVAAQVALTLSSLRQMSAAVGLYRHLSTLIEVSRALGSTLEFNALLRIIYGGARQVVDDVPSLYCIVIASSDGQQIDTELVAIDGKVEIVSPSRALAGTLSDVILKQRSPLVVENYAEACRRYGFEPPLWSGTSPCYAWVGAPMIANDQAIGVLTVGSLDPQRFYSAEQVELLTTLANQAATAVENARLYQRTQRQARQLASLNRISRIITSSLNVEQMPQLIMEQAQQLLDVEEGSLLLVASDSDLVFAYTTGPTGGRLLGQHIPRTKGIAGYVVTTGRSEVVNNVRKDHRFYADTDEQTGFVTRSLLAVPLQGRIRIEGVIEVVNKRSGQPFDEEDRMLLEALADQAVIALENAQRFSLIDQALARRAQRLALSNSQLREILRIGNMLRVEHRLDELLSQVAEGVSQCTGFRAALISLVRRQGVGHPLLEHTSAAGLSLDLDELPQLPLSVVEDALRPEMRLSDNTYLLPADYADAILQDVALPPWCRDQNLILCPLSDSSGVLLGLLTVTTPRNDDVPTIEQVQSLEIFANQAATMLENASLYNRLQHSLQSLTALNALSMALNSTLRSVRQIVSLTAGGAVASTGALGAAVLLVDPPAADPHLIFATRGLDSEQLAPLVSQVVAAQRPEQLSAKQQALPETIVAAGGQSLVVVPLRATQAVLGALIVYYAEAEPIDSALETLVLFASQAAVAVENLQLLNALRESRDRLMSIMASTREGMLMIAPDGHVLVANAALRRLCGLDQPVEGQPLEVFFNSWCFRACYNNEECSAIREAVSQVSLGEASFVDGEISLAGSRPQAFEWAVLPVRGEGRSSGGVLLVLRDISAAKETERLRQDLINMIIHDLRSPIGSVIAALDLLFRGIPGPLTPTQHSVLTIAHTSSHTMLSMVNMLLDISRLEGGSMPLARGAVHLAPLVAQACQNLAQLAESRQVHIDYVIPDDLLRVFADDELIIRVCQNLIDNAIKFSSVGGVVRVNALYNADDLMVTLSFRDYGVGIAPEHQAKIFEKFEQVGERRGGSGLGLTFCQLAVEAHGGQIWVESTPGTGSTFSFSLPVSNHQ